jgi:putative ABC transport system ATP-binding protein
MTRSATPLIHCESIVRDFSQAGGKVRVLHGITCKFWPGELVLITGPSGCGKTTLVSVLGGILEPTSGSVSCLGSNLEHMDSQSLAAFRLRHFGFVFQQLHLLPALTAAENVALPLAAAGASRRDALARAVPLLESVGLGDHLHKRPKMLSGGQMQRVAIARALVHDPQLLICDEPTSALDSQAGMKVMEIIRHAASDRQRGCIIVTHDPRIESMADRILRMEDGRVVEDKHIKHA